MSILDELLRQHSYLHVHDEKRSSVEEILQSLVNDGRQLLHVVSDFDFTLTVYEKNGFILPTSFGVIEFNSRVKLSDNSILRDKAEQLRSIYHPIEIDIQMSETERLPYLIEWAHKSQALLLSSNLNKSFLRELVQESTMELKENVPEFITELIRTQTPILILSAGLGDVIEHFLQTKIPEFKRGGESCHIISNFIQYDTNGLPISFGDKLIHSLNKNEYEIHDTPFFRRILDRPNVILLGDMIHDINIIHGIKNIKRILKIGYLNHTTEHHLTEYKKVYDLVISNNQTFDVPNAIFNIIV